MRKYFFVIIVTLLVAPWIFHVIVHIWPGCFIDTYVDHVHAVVHDALVPIYMKNLRDRAGLNY